MYCGCIQMNWMKYLVEFQVVEFSHDIYSIIII